jgi:hypothetical protein
MEAVELRAGWVVHRGADRGPEALLGAVVLSGPTQMRILEDGSTTQHRLGIGEITIAPHTDRPPLHRHAQHDGGLG